MFSLYFTLDIPPGAVQLATSAAARLASGFRPATLRQYTRMWKDFLAFQVAAGLLTYQVTLSILLAYLEFLATCQLSESNISNNIAALRALHVIHGLPTSPFKDERIPLFIKSLKLTKSFAPKVSPVLNTDLLLQIVQTCEARDHPIVYKALYLFRYFSFLRMSNILPHSTTTYDYTRHISRGDIIFSQIGATIIIKWSKTIQNRKDVCTISIPALGTSPLCPIAAITRLLHTYPGSDNDPLFRIYSKQHLAVLTDSLARKHLKKISQILHLDPHLTFHTFRRAASTWAFQHGVPLEHIKAHGTWKSDAVWTYLQASHTAASPVSSAFRQHLFL